MNEEFEKEAARKGYNRIYLHAREVALEFYDNLGYGRFGEEFIEIGIKHQHMQKILNPIEAKHQDLILRWIKTGSPDIEKPF